MTTILFVFLIALALSLVLTPLAGKLGERFGSLDVPMDRSVHTSALPRSGGLAIIVSFLLALTISHFFATQVSDLLIINPTVSAYLLGATLVCGAGIFDDFRRLSPMIKFIFQLIAASVAFFGGLQITGFVIGNTIFQFGIFSYVITVFWIVLFINAMNLIDGLDGLAAGITFFASSVMVFLSLMKGDYLMGMLFAALGGSVLGFLRYNFNPATVFMGDGGSYFLGYTIACFSIFASVKSQVGATLLIPLLALGVPIFDTILSPLRRFILGKKMFHPDRGHIHHRLIDMGISAKQAVWIIYGVSAVLCAASIIIINIRDEAAGFLLIILAAGPIILVRKLGYLEYIAMDKIYGWFRDVSDVTGFSRDRRSFLSLQLEIGASKSMDEVWKNFCCALEVLKFSRGELIVGNHNGGWFQNAEYRGAERRQEKGDSPYQDRNPSHNMSDTVIWHTCIESEEGKRWIWTRGPYRRSTDIENKNGFFKMEVPLLNESNGTMGVLVLMRDLRREPLDPFTIRRVEHLRRTLTNTLQKLKNQG